MSASGPKVTFSSEEKELFKPLFVQLATKAKTLEDIEAELSSQVFKKFKVYAAVMKATLDQEKAKAKKEIVEEVHSDLKDLTALQQQRLVYERQLAEQRRALELERQRAATQMTGNARTVKVEGLK